MFSASEMTPWLDAPSPKNTTATRPSPSSCAPSAAPTASPTPPPTMPLAPNMRSEEHTSELQSLMRISYAVFCLKKKKNSNKVNILSLSSTIQQDTSYISITCYVLTSPQQ